MKKSTCWLFNIYQQNRKNAQPVEQGKKFYNLRPYYFVTIASVYQLRDVHKICNNLHMKSIGIHRFLFPLSLFSWSGQIPPQPLPSSLSVHESTQNLDGKRTTVPLFMKHGTWIDCQMEITICMSLYLVRSIWTVVFMVIWLYHRLEMPSSESGSCGNLKATGPLIMKLSK